MRCVVCHPVGAELPGELFASLSKRMGRITICTDMYGALAECCLIERARDDQEARAGGVLVIVHPRQMPEGDAARLVEAARNYAPSIALWRYDRSANPKLRAVVEEDVARAFALTSPTVSTPAHDPGVTERPAPPVVQTRPIGDFAPKQMNGAGRPPQQTPARPGARASSMLTEDELRMLLSNDPMDAGPLPFRPPQGSPRAPGKGGAS
jgi:hypothetical protein